MTSFLISWFTLAFAVWATAKLMPSIELRSPASALAVAAVFGLLNFFLGKIFLVLAGFATLGIAWLLSFITRWLIDALLLKMTGGVLESFRVETYGSALLGALLMSGIGTLAQWLLTLSGIV